MDWEKVGQAFQGGANVLAGGLMDKYQRKRDLEDWEQKQRLASQIQTGEREQEHAYQFGKQTREFTLEGIKNDLKTNPELIPYALKAEQGDEEATRILSIYAGARYQMDQKTPLTSDDLALLKDLPPQTRHVIINRHLTTLNEESKRKADLEGTLARTEREKASTAKAEQDLRVAQTKPKEDVQYKRDSAGIKQLVTRFEYDLNKLTPEIAKLQTAVSNNPYARAGIASPELQATQDQLTALEAKRDNIQKGRYAIFKYEAELQEGKPLSAASRAELNYVMNNPALVGTGDVFGGTEHFVLPGPAGPAPRVPPPVAETGTLPSMPKEESYPVGTRRKNKRTGEIQVWDGTQWKPEK